VITLTLESAKFEFKWKFADLSYVETQSQHGYMCHVAPQAITVWYFQAMVASLYESCGSAP